MYIANLARFGTVGLICYVVLLSLALVRLLTRDPLNQPMLPTRGLCLGMLAMSVILGYSHELRGEGLLLIFILLLSLGRCLTLTSRTKPNVQHSRAWLTQ